MICIIAENWENCVKIHVKNYKTGNTKWTISVRDRTPSANINSAIRLCEIVKSKVSLAWVLISIEFSHFPMKIRENLHDKTAMARHSASRDPNSQIQLIKCRSKSEGIRLRLNKRLNDRFSNKKKFNPSIASRRWWPFHGDTNRLIDYDESSARCEPKVELGARDLSARNHNRIRRTRCDLFTNFSNLLRVVERCAKAMRAHTPTLFSDNLWVSERENWINCQNM